MKCGQTTQSKLRRVLLLPMAAILTWHAGIEARKQVEKDKGQKDKGLLGCYRYKGQIEQLNVYRKGGGVMNEWNVGSCMQHCASKKHRFSGIIFRSVCHCSDTVPANGRLKSAQCPFRCQDNPFHNCGGPMAVSLLKNPFHPNSNRKLNLTLSELCFKEQGKSPYTVWASLHQPSCQVYVSIGCFREKSKDFIVFKGPVIVPFMETYPLYFCVRHCKSQEYKYAAYSKITNLCACANSLKNTVRCHDSEGFEVYSTDERSLYDDQGCFQLQRDFKEKFTPKTFTYLSDCAVHCKESKYFGFSLTATCGCEHSYISSPKRDDHFCDVTCRWAPAHRCGSTSMVAIYDSDALFGPNGPVKFPAASLRILSDKAAFYKMMFSMTGLCGAFILFLILITMMTANERKIRNRKLEYQNYLSGKETFSSDESDSEDGNKTTTKTRTETARDTASQSKSEIESSFQTETETVVTDLTSPSNYKPHRYMVFQ